MLTFPKELLLDPKFTRWMSSSQGRVWMALIGMAVKEIEDNKTSYEDKITTCVSLDMLNESLGYKSKDKSNVRKTLDKLTSGRIIRKKSITVNKKPVKVYELGYFSNENKKIVPYVFDIFYKKKIKENLEKMGFIKKVDFTELNQEPTEGER